MGMFSSRKSDKECAKELTAAAIVSRGDQSIARELIERNLTREEMARGAAYLQSGKKVTGPS
ncbi:hypothetical protein AB0L04_00600 [Streptomyces glaucescens]|uniref:hypothetical protein n=1 Tax=Streptomyces glaucescens TaxID=1907 RepID=UPI00344EB6C1